MLLSQTFLIFVYFTFMGISVASSVSCVKGKPNHWTIGQVVHTTSGSVKGHGAPLSPSVSEYLGIRYAQPATGKLRFAAPAAYKSSGKIPGDKYVRYMVGFCKGDNKC